MNVASVSSLITGNTFFTGSSIADFPDNTSDVNSSVINVTSSVSGTGNIRQYLKNVEYICQGVMMPLIAIVGIIGNVLILVVLTRKTIVCASNYFLAAIAVSDTCFLVFQMFLQLLVHGTASPYSYSLVGGYYWIIWYVATHMLFNATIWLTAAVVLERYISLRFSLRLPIKRIKIIVAVIFVASVVLNFSKCFEFVPSLEKRLLKPAIETAIFKRAYYSSARSIVNCSLVVLIPLLLMVVFDCLLLRFLLTHRRRMSVHGPTSASGCNNIDVHHVGVSVFSVVVLFIVCFLPEVYNSFNLAINGSKIYSKTINVVLVYVGRVLGTVNSSGNFFVYIAANRHFRRRLIAILAKYRACRSLARVYADVVRRGSSFSSSFRKISMSSSTHCDPTAGLKHRRSSKSHGISDKNRVTFKINSESSDKCLQDAVTVSTHPSISTSPDPSEQHLVGSEDVASNGEVLQSIS